MADPEPSSSTNDSERIQDQDSLEYADEMKAQGNDHFRAGRWEEALASYRVGLGRLPKRKAKKKTPTRDDDATFDMEREHDSVFGKEQEEEKEEEEEEDIYSQPRAVLNANIAACFMKLGDDKEVVSACSEALQDNPKYIKALQRRATSNERLDTWSSLASAQEDYQKLLDLLPESSSSDRSAAQRKLTALKPRVEEAQKKETAEMMGKLKGIGNNILGKFGLSTDNFQFVPNGQGGYSMNFQR
ncbi:hypothetical protein PM082_015879 [Marasmius tenuissimus]|nr:hypothetical protein PM082_015879 [Marasmius tenuissimus]